MAPLVAPDQEANNQIFTLAATENTMASHSTLDAHGSPFAESKDGEDKSAPSSSRVVETSMFKQVQDLLQ